MLHPKSRHITNLKILSNLYDYLFPTTKFEVISRLPIEISMERLKSCLVIGDLWDLGKEGLVGEVNRNRVILKHYKPRFGYLYSPIFCGTFTQRDSTILLTGKFAVPETATGLVNLCFFMCGLCIVFSLKSNISFLGVLAVGIFLTLNIACFKILYSNSTAYLINRIKHALEVY